LVLAVLLVVLVRVPALVALEAQLQLRLALNLLQLFLPQVVLAQRALKVTQMLFRLAGLVELARGEI
jgi:hypothetical protein